MKIVAVFVLVALLAGCNMPGGSQSQLAALQKQVDTLSAKVGKIEAAKTVAANFGMQDRCRVAAERNIRDQRSGWVGMGYNLDNSWTKFNKASHMCFLLEGFDGVAGSTLMNLIMVPQNVTYGVYWVDGKGHLLNCYVWTAGVEAPCTSKPQFDADAARYMGRAWALRNDQ